MVNSDCSFICNQVTSDPVTVSSMLIAPNSTNHSPLRKETDNINTNTLISTYGSKMNADNVITIIDSDSDSPVQQQQQIIYDDDFEIIPLSMADQSQAATIPSPSAVQQAPIQDMVNFPIDVGMAFSDDEIEGNSQQNLKLEPATDILDFMAFDDTTDAESPEVTEEAEQPPLQLEDDGDILEIHSAEKNSSTANQSSSTIPSSSNDKVQPLYQIPRQESVESFLPPQLLKQSGSSSIQASKEAICSSIPNSTLNETIVLSSSTLVSSMSPKTTDDPFVKKRKLPSTLDSNASETTLNNSTEPFVKLSSDQSTPSSSQRALPASLLSSGATPSSSHTFRPFFSSRPSPYFKSFTSTALNPSKTSSVIPSSNSLTPLKPSSDHASSPSSSLPACMSPAMKTPLGTPNQSSRTPYSFTTSRQNSFSANRRFNKPDTPKTPNPPIISVDLTVDSDSDNDQNDTNTTQVINSPHNKSQITSTAKPQEASRNTIVTPPISNSITTASAVSESDIEITGFKQLTTPSKRYSMLPSATAKKIPPQLLPKTDLTHPFWAEYFCLGMVYTYIIRPAHAQVAPQIPIHPSGGSVAIFIMRDHNKSELHAFEQSQDRTYLGIIEPKVGTSVCKIWGKVTATGVTKKVYATATSMYLQLIIYGRRGDAQEIWNAFSSNKIGINEPTKGIPLLFPYLNPREKIIPPFDAIPPYFGGLAMSQGTSSFTSVAAVAETRAGLGSPSSSKLNASSPNFSNYRDPNVLDEIKSLISSGMRSSYRGDGLLSESFEAVEVMQPEVQNKVHTQIEQIYNSLSAPEDILMAEPDVALSSKLYKHQKQALYFMMLKEDKPDYQGKRKDGFHFHSLWKLNGRGKYESLITGLKRGEPPLDARGGILADDMGLGKTIVTISLILTKRPPQSNTTSTSVARSEGPQQRLTISDQLSLRRDVFGFVKSQSNNSSSSNTSSSSSSSSSSFGPDDLIPSNTTLIVCPLSTVSNWEEQFEMHVEPGTLSIHVFHGPGRTTNPYDLTKHDVVITTYNILSMCAAPVKKKGEEQAPVAPSILHKIKWFRVVLDEAHLIKNQMTAMSRSACSLSALNRWCLTGTPIQNKIDDVFALIKFLQLEPLNTKGNWQTFISMPLKNSQGSQATLAVHRLQTLMKAITLRRSKNHIIDGKPILSLPPKTEEFREVPLSEGERKVYDAIQEAALREYHELEQQGSLLAHYMSLLERILRMRQACLHPALCQKVIEKRDGSQFRDDLKDSLSNLINPTSSSASTPSSSFTLKKAKRAFALLRDADEDICSGCQQKFDDLASAANDEKSDDASRSDSDSTTRLPVAITKCNHLFCWNCYKKPLRQDSNLTCQVCSMSLVPDKDVRLISLSQLDNDKNEVNNNANFGKTMQRGSNPNKSDTLDEDDDEDDLSGEKVAIDGFDDDSFQALFSEPSTKVRLLLEELNILRNNSILTGQPIEKAIVFSQWTHMLNLLTVPLQEQGFKLVRLDGSMSRAERHEAITAFRVDPSVTVFLISLKAGGVGLNLTMGSRVYILEPYWNPAVEQQAIDRVHRLGQTRPVYAVHFVAKDSIEERMLALQKHKMELARLTFNEPEAEEEEGGPNGQSSNSNAEANKRKRRITKDDDKLRRRLERLNDLKMLFGV